MKSICPAQGLPLGALMPYLAQGLPRAVTSVRPAQGLPPGVRMPLS